MGLVAGTDCETARSGMAGRRDRLRLEGINETLQRGFSRSAAAEEVTMTRLEVTEERPSRRRALRQRPRGPAAEPLNAGVTPARWRRVILDEVLGLKTADVELVLMRER